MTEGKTFFLFCFFPPHPQYFEMNTEQTNTTDL